MIKKYLFPLLVILIFYSASAHAQKVADSVANPNYSLTEDSTGKYNGTDAGFVKGRLMNVGVIRCFPVKYANWGMFITIPYVIHRIRKKNEIDVDLVKVGTWGIPPKTETIRGVIVNAENKRSKINFAIAMGDIISFEGNFWRMTLSVYGWYDTSNGTYSVHFSQTIPVTQTF